MADEISRWSEELARDPGSQVFLQLGEAVRRQGQLDVALKIALRGLERHPHSADAHDLLARICVDRRELQRAFDEWDMTLRMNPRHVGAMKGMGFVCFQMGRMEDAERFLQQAAALGGGDAVNSALATVRRSGATPAMEESAPASETPAPSTETTAPPQPVVPTQPIEDDDPRLLFAHLLSDHGQAAILLDDEGLVLAGAYPTVDGNDIAQEIGAELSGVSDEARRATRHLDIGNWRSITVETEVAVIAMMPTGASGVGDGGLVLLTTSRATPLGLLRRLLERCTERARGWLERTRAAS